MKHPIGVFDSGLGGLTVLREIWTLMPQYDYLYLGDNARAPYGTKDFETVYQYTLEAVKWLFGQGCPLVVLACNTASAKALRTIQQKDLPTLAPDKRVLGVIRPTTEVIGDYTDSNHIGILATQGTVDSMSYVIELNKFFPDVHVHQQACPTWVPLVEQGLHNTPEADVEIEKCLRLLAEQSPTIDTILLACTHYPLLYAKIRANLPSHIQLVSQGEIVAASLKDYFIRHPEIESRISHTGQLKFFTTGDQDAFGHAASRFWGSEVIAEKVE